MVEILGYLRWVVLTVMREPFGWTLCLLIAGAVMNFTAVPEPWPSIITGAGVGMLAALIIYHIVAVSFDHYRRERDEAMKELRNKNGQD
jgi:hypothetical protein